MALINGTTDDETLAGTTDDDTLFGDAGDDILIGGGGTDALDGGDGFDTVSYAGATGPVTASLQAGSAGSIDGGETLANIEAIVGSDYDDDLSGDSGDNGLSGGLGNDTLSGGGGLDALDGGDGDNTYIYSGGNVVIDNVDTGGATEDYGLGDTLVLTGLNPADVSFARDSVDSNDLLITVTSTGDIVLVKYYFSGSLVSNEAIGLIRFADNSTLTADQVNALIGVVNEAPVASDDSAKTSMFNPITVDVLANDYDPENDAFTLTGISGTSTLGDFTDNGDGTVTFTPNASGPGTAELTYTIEDSEGNTDTATLTITVTDGSNTAPVANDDSDFAHLSPVTIDVLGNDSDEDGDTLTVTNLTPSTSLGSFVDNGDGTVTFTPNASATGDASATYTIDDGNGHTVQGTLTVTVVNAAPVLTDDSVSAHQAAVTVDVLGNDVDPDADTLTVTGLSTGTTLGDFVVNGDNSVTFTPNGSGLGDAVATVTVTDSFGASTQAQLTVTVANSAPAVLDDQSATYDAPVTVAVLANDSDSDSDALTVTGINTTTTLGDFVLNGDNTVTFTPNGSGTGDAVVTYDVADGVGGTAQGQLTVTVTDTVLVATDDFATTDATTPVSVDVLANDQDLAGLALTVTGLSTASSLGSFVDNGDGTLTFTPNGSGSGDAVATYTVTDTGGNSAQAEVTITVTALDQSVTGATGSDNLSGAAGNDTLEGLDGNDVLYGQGGADTLDGGAGLDKLYGGAGDDVLYAASSTNLIVNGSFETGDLSGWNAHLYNGAAYLSVETGSVTPVSGITISAPTDGSYHAVFDEDDIAAHALIQTITVPAASSSLVLSFDLYAENQAGVTSYNGSHDVTAGPDEQFVRIDLLTAGADAWDLGAGVAVNLFQGLVTSPTDQHFSFELQGYVSAGQSYQLRFSQASNVYIQTLALDNVRLQATSNDGRIDLLAGGDGDDTYVLDGPVNTVVELADEGTDTIKVNFSYTLSANVENLTLGGLSSARGVGNSLDNVIQGNGGSNLLQGQAGNDQLYGGAGSDHLDGGLGDDSLDGGLGSDVVSYSQSGGAVTVDLTLGTAAGGAGDDRLFNIESILGSDYDDTLGGSAAGNTLQGAGGDDVLSGEAGNDVLTGGLGNDSIDGGTGSDILTGGLGNDELTGGAGMDTASYAGAGSGVTVDLGLGTATGGDGDDTLADIESIVGSAHADLLTGDGNNNTLRAGAGNDTVSGGLGNDNLMGGAGNDDLDGGDGNDALTGGLGDDVLTGGAGMDSVSYADAGSAVTVDLGLGTATGGDGDDTLSGIESATGSAYADLLTGDGNNNTLRAGAGNDTVSGGLGNDNLMGGAGNDDLDGGDGNDALTGGLGDDVLTGGLGTDSASYAAAGSAVTVDLGLGTATGGDGDDTLSGIENLVGSAYNDLLTGDANANTVQAGAGDDTVTGGLGNDNLMGGAGNDDLDGGDGNDALTGGLGDDVLTGGLGTDSASYAAAGSAVTVDLGLGTATGGDGDDTLSGIENLVGSAYNDLLTGDANANTVQAGAGDDTVSGGLGNDNLLGGLGNDDLDGGDGNDALTGGLGDDVLTGGLGTDSASYAAAGSAVTVDLGLGTATGGDGDDTLSGIENLVGSAYDDLLTGDGNANTVQAGAGDDLLFGGLGNDNLLGGAGNDDLDGGEDRDTLAGGAGDDIYHLGPDSGLDTVSDTEGNADSLLVDAGITTDQLWFRKIGNNLEVSVIGTANKATIANWYTGSGYHLEQFSADGKTLLDSDVQNLVAAMAAFTVPALGQTSLTTEQHAALDTVIAASWT